MAVSKSLYSEHFARWWAWSLYYGDCDPAVWLTRYLNERFEHNAEQRYWFAWLYGNTYHLPTAWVLLNEFPDFELATVERMESWNQANYPRLRYQVDTKWNKGHLPKMFASYQEWVFSRGGTQGEAFASIVRDKNPKQSFDAVWKEIKSKLFKFGRYSTWFYLQHLHSTCGLNLEPTSLMLSDYSGSKSHRNGLLHALGREEWLNAKLRPEQYALLEREAEGLLGRTREILARESLVGNRVYEPSDLNAFTMETALCSFKKLFRVKKGRYLGYYLDRQAEEIQRLEQDGWYGINWEVLWQARQECLARPELAGRDAKVDKAKFALFLEEGRMDRVDWLSGSISNLTPSSLAPEVVHAKGWG